MKKRIMFMGRSGAGKTTLTQALYGEDIEYHKTQYVNYSKYIIDPPGEYIEDKQFGFVLALYSYEVDIVGYILAANEPFSLYSPCSTAQSTREVIGIVTQINDPNGDRELAAEWLRIAGCEKVFFVDSVTREGLDKLIDYLGWNEGEKQDGVKGNTSSPEKKSAVGAEKKKRGRKKRSDLPSRGNKTAAETQVSPSPAATDDKI